MSVVDRPTVLVVGEREELFLRVKNVLAATPHGGVGWSLFCEIGRIPFRLWADEAKLILVDAGSPQTLPRGTLELVGYLSDQGQQRKVAVITTTTDIREARPYLEAGAFSAFAMAEADADLKRWLLDFLVVSVAGPMERVVKLEDGKKGGSDGVSGGVARFPSTAAVRAREANRPTFV